MSGFSIIAVVVGGLFLLGVARGYQVHRFVRRALRVRAKVVATLDATVSNHDTGSQSASTSRYVVEILERDGRKRRVALSDAIGGSIGDTLVATDETIAVIYDPRHPTVVRIDSPWALYLTPLFLCAPAMLFLALVVYVWLMT